MPHPKILYSTGSKLAYRINVDFYRDTHYVWCSPDYSTRDAGSGRNPPSSTPRNRYRSLREEAIGNDLGGLYISAQRSGIIVGAEAKFSAGVISLEQKEEILAAANRATPADFQPVLYIMPFELVRDLVERVPVAQRAAPLSQEYLIRELPGSKFDVWEID